MNLYNLSQIEAVSNEPDEASEFHAWCQQDDVLPFLQSEISDEDVLLYAAADHTFIHAVFIPRQEIDESTVDDLSKFNGFQTSIVCE